MATLGDLESQLQAQEGAMSQYTSELPSQIESEIKRAWTPAMERAVGVTESQMQDFLPRFWELPETLGGTTAADLSPTQKLGQMGQELGTMGGRLQSSQRISDYLGAQISDLVGKGQQAAQLGYQMEADKYGRLADQYNMAWQAAEQEKQRQWQAEQNAMSRAGSGTGGLDLSSLAGLMGPNISEGIAQLEQIDRRGITAQQRYDQARSIIEQYPGIDEEAAYEAAGFSPYWNPALNPGKWGGGQQVTYNRA